MSCEEQVKQPTGAEELKEEEEIQRATMKNPKTPCGRTEDWLPK